MGRADEDEDLIVRCVDCLLYDPDFLQDDGYCSVCGKSLAPKVVQGAAPSTPGPAPSRDPAAACRLCGAPAGPDGGFCTSCELMVLGELEVQEPVSRIDVADGADVTQLADAADLTDAPDAPCEAPAPPVENRTPAEDPPLELESWWVPSFHVAVTPPQEPPHEELATPEPARESAPVATALLDAEVPVPAVVTDAMTADEPPVESWLVPPPSELVAPPSADAAVSDVSPAPWWAPAVAAAGPPAPPVTPPAEPAPDVLEVVPPPLPSPRPAGSGGPTPGVVVRPSYSASARPVARGPAAAARRPTRPKRSIQAAAIRQPFLVAALLAVTAGASYATREWMVERLMGGASSPIQARPAYAAMTAGPVVLATPPPSAPVDVPSRTVEAPPPPSPAAPPKPATPAKPAPPPKTARKATTPPRPTSPVKTEVRPNTVAPPVVTAMTAPPPASMAPPPPETPVRAVEPVPEPLPKSQVFEVSQVDVRPEVANRTEPSYPASARERGVEDVVVVRVLVSASGRAADTQLLRRSRRDAAFDSAALNAVRQWTFTPARKRDRVVSCWMNVGVPFRMPRAEGSQ